MRVYLREIKGVVPRLNKVFPCSHHTIDRGQPVSLKLVASYWLPGLGVLVEEVCHSHDGDLIIARHRQ